MSKNIILKNDASNAMICLYPLMVGYLKDILADVTNTAKTILAYIVILANQTIIVIILLEEIKHVLFCREKNIFFCVYNIMPCSACDSYKNNKAIHLMNSYKKSNHVKKYRFNNQLIKKKIIW